jgi:hypothetical protein
LAGTIVDFLSLSVCIDAPAPLPFEFLRQHFRLSNLLIPELHRRIRRTATQKNISGKAAGEQHHCLNILCFSQHRLYIFNNAFHI